MGDRIILEFFGKRVEVRSTRATLINLVRRHWASYEVARGAMTSRQAASGERALLDVSFEGCGIDESRPQVYSGEQFYFATDASLYRVTGYFRARAPQVYLQIFGSPAKRYAMPQAISASHAYFHLVEPVLLSLLRRMGLMHWHCAGVRGSRGAILLAGPSGSGKSTTAGVLLSAGFKLLADDEAFIELRDGEVRVRAKESALHLLPDALDRLPRPAGLQDPQRVRRGRRYKQRFEFAPPSRGGSVAKVRLVIFPRVGRAAQPTFAPLSPAVAIARCLALRPKEHPAIMQDASALQLQFDAYAELARVARFYDLQLGHDSPANLALIQRLFKGVES